MHHFVSCVYCFYLFSSKRFLFHSLFDGVHLLLLFLMYMFLSLSLSLSMLSSLSSFQMYDIWIIIMIYKCHTLRLLFVYMCVWISFRVVDAQLNFYFLMILLVSVYNAEVEWSKWPLLGIPCGHQIPRRCRYCFRLKYSDSSVLLGMRNNRIKETNMEFLHCVDDAATTSSSDEILYWLTNCGQHS